MLTKLSNSQALPSINFLFPIAAKIPPTPFEKGGVTERLFATVCSPFFKGGWGDFHMPEKNYFQIRVFCGRI